MEGNKVIPVTVGRLALYKLSAQDALDINSNRNNTPGIMGNHAVEGQEFPILVIAVHSDECFNGQVMLDGNDSLWKTSCVRGEENGQWDWMPFQKDQQARLAKED